VNAQSLPSADGFYQVQRLIRWTSYQSQNEQVESIWTGVLIPNAMEFSLGLSNVLTSFADAR
jgi:hypothetical protein